ncbi:hypothetical protein [Isoptericola sp. NPDC019482]|uniref:hypothetical protein n=1 Tax=Isoptericola sp. NPDC019482 TaxID=3154688 RepID=UPI00348013A3
MSALGRWSLGIGIVLVVVAVVLAAVFNLFGGAALVGIVGLVGVVMGLYDAAYQALARRDLRRRGERAQQRRDSR